MPVQNIDSIRIMRGVIKLGDVGAVESLHVDYGEFVPGQCAINFEGNEIAARGGFSRRKNAVAITEDGLTVTAQLQETTPAALAAILGFENHLLGVNPPLPTQSITAILDAAKKYYSAFVYGYDQAGRFYKLHIPKASIRKQNFKIDLGGTAVAAMDIAIEAVDDGSTNGLYTLENLTAVVAPIAAPTPTPAANGTHSVATNPPLTLVFTSDLSATANNLSKVKLYDVTNKAWVSASISYASASKTITVAPATALTTVGNVYVFLVDKNLEDIYGNKLAADFSSAFSIVA